MLNDIIKESFCKPSTYEENTPQRILYIDLAKGICILMVVLYHLKFVEFTGSRQIRMPLYFFLSGMFFKNYGSPINLIIKKTNKIIIPFIFFLLISLISFIICDTTRQQPETIQEILLKLANSNFHDLILKINGPLWFLLCLFYVNIIYCTITLVLKNKLQSFLCILTLSIIGQTIGNTYGLMGWLISAINALPFFYCGNIMRKTSLLKDNGYEKRAWLGVVGLICYSICAGGVTYYGNYYIEFAKCTTVGNPILAYIFSIFGTLALIMFCKCIKWLPLISYIGRYSIIVLGMHLPLYGLVRLLVSDEQFQIINTKLLIVVIYIFILWLSIPVLTRLFPYFTAQKDIFKIKTVKQN